MQTAEYDVNDFTPQGQQAGDEKLLVKFFVKPREDKAATLKAGRPMFSDVEYIDIRIPGNRTGGACRPASHADKQRFPRHYAAFKQRIEAPLEGTPLAEWPMVTRSQVEEFSFHNIKTVEHLAELSDTHASNFMGINALKKKAKTWLESAGKTADAAAIAERDEKIATLEAKIDMLMAKMDGDDEPAPEEPKPTPKRKRRARKKVTGDGAIQDNQ